MWFKWSLDNFIKETANDNYVKVLFALLEVKDMNSKKNDGLELLSPVLFLHC